MPRGIRLPVERSLTARLFSTRHPRSLLSQLTADRLTTPARGAESLTIISGFYDVRWCWDLVVAAGVNHARLVFNGLGGIRLARQVRELRKLRADAARAGIELDVRLAFAPGIFHSKLILIDHAKRPAVFIGSANATTAAMVRNEEIMLRVTGDLADLVDYADRICEKHSLDVDEIDEQAPESLIAFFRTGSLYFRSASSLQLTLNPFREIERVMPRSMKAKLGSVSLPHTERKTGVGPFSLARALNLGVDRTAVPARFKRFVVETSLGYWVPDALAKELQDVLKGATKARRIVWTRRRETILATSLKDARRRYSEYTNGIRRIMTSKGIDPPALLGSGARDPLAVARFDGFFRSVRRRLKNAAFFERLINPFQGAGVPEIWEDALARKEFEESFFTYLEFASSLRYRPRVPRIILDELDGSPTSWREIRKALVKRLRDGWSPDLWR